MAINGRCIFWREPCNRWKVQVEETIKVKDKELRVIDFGNFGCFEKARSAQSVLLEFCRKYKCLKNFQTSFLNTKDHLMALQLSLAQATKQTGESLTLSEVMFCHKQYIKQIDEDVPSSSSSLPLTVVSAIKQYRAFLSQSNSVNEWQLLQVAQCTYAPEACQYDLLILGMPRNNVYMEMLKLLSEHKRLLLIESETRLDDSFSGNLENGQMEMKLTDITWDYLSKDPSCFAEYRCKFSVSQIYVEEVLCAFLRLLVNSRDELALARACPIVKMNHEGFTALKKVSSSKEMPMCQVAISYVTRLQLGGKGYAPETSCPIKPYVAELKDLVEILQKLQSTIEDDPSPGSATKRIIAVLKNRFLRCGQIKSESVIAAAEKFQKIAADCALTETTIEESKILGIETLLLLRRICDMFSSLYLYEDNLTVLRTPASRSQRTPLSVPSVLHFFQTPENVEMIEPLRERTKRKTVTSYNEDKFLAGLPWGHDGSVTVLNPLDDMKLSKIMETEIENLPNCDLDGSERAKETGSTPKKDGMEKGRKRNILSDISNQKKKTKPSQQNHRNKKKQITGQQQLTKFFRRD